MVCRRWAIALRVPAEKLTPPVFGKESIMNYSIFVARSAKFIFDTFFIGSLALRFKNGYGRGPPVNLSIILSN